MRLIRVEIDGYKHLEKTCVNFNDTPETGLFREEVPVRFFIGLNGSGKSVFLEALCILFSRIVQNETPGFGFELVYSIQRDALYRVEVTNSADGRRLRIRAQRETESWPKELSTFAEHRYLLPDYVFTCASGGNNNFSDIMVHAPRASLYSELFDLSLFGQSRLGERSRRRGTEKIRSALRLLEENPISLFVDEQNALFVLAAFLAVIPQEGSREAEGYIRCRREILSMLYCAPEPVSLSLTLDAKRFEALGEEAELYGEIFRSGGAGMYGRASGQCFRTVRLYQDEAVDVEEAHGDIVLSFLFEPYTRAGQETFYIRALTEAYKNPLELLSKLMLAKQKGIIRSGHLSFRISGTEDLLEENALSEGEYMLLVRLGLLSVCRSGGNGSQSLFLLDEPDVYLNEQWAINFIAMLHRIYAGTEARHEIVIATHSSLMLTDALPEQLYYFERSGGVKCHNVRASTFGGSRNEIMQALFQTGSTVGSYAQSKLDLLLEETNDIALLEEALTGIGSGYLRLRILDKIQLLRQRGEQ